MPFKSDRQRKAMYSAAKGRSTIGISKRAAKKFVAHSEKKSKPKRKNRK